MKAVTGSVIPVPDLPSDSPGFQPILDIIFKAMLFSDGLILVRKALMSTKAFIGYSDFLADFSEFLLIWALSTYLPGSIARGCLQLPWKPLPPYRN